MSSDESLIVLIDADGVDVVRRETLAADTDGATPLRSRLMCSTGKHEGCIGNIDETP